MTDDFSRIVPVYCSLHGHCKFVGTAFFVDGRHLLTARHVLEPYDPARQFRPRDPAARFGVLLPTEGSTDDERRWVEVEVVDHAPDAQDASLLRIPAESVIPGESFRWLKGMDEAGWTDRSSGVQFRVRGFPKSMPELPEPAIEWIGKIPKPQRNLHRIADPTFDDDAGLVRCEMLGAENLPGTSGAPVLWTTTGGDYCLGLATEGGARTRVLGAGALLAWLSGLGVETKTVDLADIRDERLVPHLERVQELACSLLVPVLGLPREEESVGTAVPIPQGLLRFLDLFIHLHARDRRSEEPPRIRREMLQAIYEQEVSEWGVNKLTLPPFAEAEAGLGDGTREHEVGKRALRVAHRVGRVLAGDPDQPPTDQEPWEIYDVAGYPVWFRERVESGEMELLEAVSLWSALTRTRQMVLVGDAGCGKTTAALFLALALTTPPAERQHPKLVELAVDHPEFSRRLPVLVRLREERARRFDSARDVEAMLRSGFDRDESGWDVASRYLDEGRALRLFDGLDELDTPDSRKALARVLGEWQRERRRSGNLILVTSRPTAYPPVDRLARPGWEFKGFGLWELQPLTPRQQRLFLEAWFAGAPDAAGQASRVFSEIQAKALQELARDPLMLVGLARLAEDARADGGEPRSLPSTRPAVLDALIDLMMTRWERARAGRQDFSRIEVCLRALGLTPEELRHILADLSLDSMRPRSRVGDFDRSALEERIRRLLKTRPESATQEQDFRSLMDEMGRASGLVRPKEDRASGGGAEADVPVMEFPVRPFRNHLAGEALFRGHGDAALDRAIGCVERGMAPVLGWAEVGQENQVHAAEVVHLGLCNLAQRVGLRGFLESFRQRIVRRCPGHPVFCLIRAAVRVARELDGWRCVQEGGMVRLEPGETALAAEWVGLLHAALRSGLESRMDRAAMASLVGLLEPALSPVESFTVEGQVPPPCRSWTPPGEGTRPSASWIEWSRIAAPGGSGFILGDEFHWGGGVIGCDRISSAYYMARWPVTVRQFEIYRRAASAGSSAVLFERLHPDWRVPVLHVPSHPVVGVDHEMATAFCAWLTGELRAGRLRVPEEVATDLEGWEIRLPEEWEWEYAARGESEPPLPTQTEASPLRRVPWGWADDPGILARVNCDQQWHWTLPVDFADVASASPFGVEGMVGNVWEWCRTPWVDGGNGTYPADYWWKVADPAVPTGVLRVVRGGGWYNLPVGCRCAVRYAVPPDYRDVNLGFRPVLAPVPSGASSGGAGDRRAERWGRSGPQARDEPEASEDRSAERTQHHEA